MHCFVFKIPSASVAVNGNICNMIIYYIHKPPELDPIKRDRETYEYFSHVMNHYKEI